LMRKAFVLIAR